MSPLHAQVIALRKQGLSQDAIGLKVGRTQSLISSILGRYGHSVRKMRTVNRKRRDGLVGVPQVETWEPYRILDPAIAKLVSEKYFRPASRLRTNLANRRWFGNQAPQRIHWEVVGRTL